MASTSDKATEEPKSVQRDLSADSPVTTDHQITLSGKPFKYKVTTGFMPLKTEFGDHEANVFYMAYTAQTRRKNRPLMFSFNGGPGSASVWLHLGALGPKRVKLMPDGSMPKPPHQLVDNVSTWLTETDLVFIDPVGTGYSRAIDKETGKKFWGIKGDIESVAEFIRLYITQNERWSSPLFLVGESYGTTRASGLSGYLIDRGISFNGVVLVSSILTFITARFVKGNDLPFILFLPTYAAVAHFHRKAGQGKRLDTFLRECEQFAVGQYAQFLSKGDRASQKERSEIISQLSHYTGLHHTFIDNSDLRINIHNFCKELLRGERRTIGRMDGRFKGIDGKVISEVVEHDPSISAIRPAYTSMLNDYVRKQLRFKTDLNYNILGEGIEEPWDWGSAGEGHPDTSEALRKAMSQNPFMKIFVASGYYDLATPYFATEYTLAHMGLDKTLRSNVSTSYYEAGHMMYIDEKCLSKLKRDIAVFIADALS